MGKLGQYDPATAGPYLIKLAQKAELLGAVCEGILWMGTPARQWAPELKPILNRALLDVVRHEAELTRTGDRAERYTSEFQSAQGPDDHLTRTLFSCDQSGSSDLHHQLYLPISSVTPHKACSSSFVDLGKRIENPDSGSLKILHVSGGNREVMPPRNRGDVAILNRHRFARRLELVLQFRPYVSGRDVEPKNSTVHGLNQIRQPLLQRKALLSALSTHPECQLCNHNRTRVALVLMFFQPRDDACIAGLLSRLTQHIGI